MSSQYSNNQNPNSSDSSPQIQYIKDYELIERIGAGSFGLVYKAKKSSKIYVIKQIPFTTKEEDSNQLSEAQNEAKILSELSNKYVVKYYESFEENNNLDIVMEYCEGGDLSTYLTKIKREYKNKTLPESQIWKFFIQLSIGLAYIHHKKILHRDLKSLNIFLTKNLDIKIGDFGVGKILKGTMHAHTFIGTPYYLSPEILEEKPYNEKSDVWALGCILYEIATFNHPFNASNQAALFLKIKNNKYEPIANNYSNDLKKMIALLLDKNYFSRPSMKQVIENAIFENKAKVYGFSFDRNEIIKLYNIGSSNINSNSNNFGISPYNNQGVCNNQNNGVSLISESNNISNNNNLYQGNGNIRLKGKQIKLIKGESNRKQQPNNSNQGPYTGSSSNVNQKFAKKNAICYNSKKITHSCNNLAVEPRNSNSNIQNSNFQNHNRPSANKKSSNERKISSHIFNTNSNNNMINISSSNCNMVNNNYYLYSNNNNSNKINKSQLNYRPTHINSNINLSNNKSNISHDNSRFIKSSNNNYSSCNNNLLSNHRPSYNSKPKNSKVRSNSNLFSHDNYNNRYPSVGRNSHNSNYKNYNNYKISSARNRKSESKARHNNICNSKFDINKKIYPISTYKLINDIFENDINDKGAMNINELNSIITISNNNLDTNTNYNNEFIETPKHHEKSNSNLKVSHSSKIIHAGKKYEYILHSESNKKNVNIKNELKMYNQQCGGSISNKNSSGHKCKFYNENRNRNRVEEFDKYCEEFKQENFHKINVKNNNFAKKYCYDKKGEGNTQATTDINLNVNSNILKNSNVNYFNSNNRNLVRNSNNDIYKNSNMDKKITVHELISGNSNKNKVAVNSNIQFINEGGSDNKIISKSNRKNPESIDERCPYTYDKVRNDFKMQNMQNSNSNSVDSDSCNSINNDSNEFLVVNNNKENKRNNKSSLSKDNNLFSPDISYEKDQNKKNNNNKKENIKNSKKILSKNRLVKNSFSSDNSDKSQSDDSEFGEEVVVVKKETNDNINKKIFENYKEKKLEKLNHYKKELMSYSKLIDIDKLIKIYKQTDVDLENIDDVKKQIGDYINKNLPEKADEIKKCFLNYILYEIELNKINEAAENI